MPSLPTITQLVADLHRGRRTATDLVEEALAAVERHGALTNAFIQLDAAAIRAAARARDEAQRSGADLGRLHGIPISIKDLIDVAGTATTCASHAMPPTPASADAPLVARLCEAGAVIFGKTNLHEFALGTTSDESAWNPVRHPDDPTRSAGGSSGGSAAAVATGMGVASVGTDTGGSIRIPAAACGVVGLKPTFGEISLAGVVPLSQSLDHAGPIARCVEDAACLWAVMAGRAATQLEPAVPNALRLGRLTGYFEHPLEPDVREAWDAALDTLRSAGVSITEVELPGIAGVPSAYIDIALPEAAAWHDRHIRADAGAYTPGVAARLERGRGIAAVAYLSAQETRRQFRRAVDAALDGFDALLTPTLPITAPVLGDEYVRIEDAAEPMAVRAAMLKHTQPFNLTGHPALTLPLASPGRPVGLQIVGARAATPAVLAIGAACERLLGMR